MHECYAMQILEAKNKNKSKSKNKKNKKKKKKNSTDHHIMLSSHQQHIMNTTRMATILCQKKAHINNISSTHQHDIILS